MVAFKSTVATVAALLVSQSLAAPAASVAAGASEQNLVRRGGGYPESNPPGMTCFNTWETVTNDPVVQYWYVTAPNVGNSIKADRVWNHLNLNGCAPTENKYYARDDINGSALSFHTSEACTADRVSKAFRSGSDPGVNIACEFQGKEGYPGAVAIGTKVGAALADGIFQAIVDFLMGLKP